MNPVAIEREATDALARAATPDELEALRVRYLGRKSDLKQALRQVRDRETGMALNALRERLEDAFAEREAERAGVHRLLDLRAGDLRDPPVREQVPLVLCPFRAYLHLVDDAERLDALAAARRLLVAGGCLVFDVFEPGGDDIEDTHGRWLEREPGIWERADWDERARTLTLSVRGAEAETTMTLSWLSPREWRALLEEAGFEVEACYGWFDRRPYVGGEDTVWIARRPH